VREIPLYKDSNHNPFFLNDNDLSLILTCSFASNGKIIRIYCPSKCKSFFFDATNGILISKYKNLDEISSKQAYNFEHNLFISVETNDAPNMR